VSVYYEDATITVHAGDCLDVLKSLPDSSVDSVCTDPPYGIAFMGQAWDQPGEFGSQRKIGTPGVRQRRPGRTALASRGSMEAGLYDLSPRAMGNFQQWCEAWAAECLRVLKPGGHLLSFGGTRTYHRLTCAVEDAGFEIRDSIAWLYGSGFPKSLDVSKAIDRAAGAEREVLRRRSYEFTDGGGYSGNLNTSKPRSESAEITAPATDAARTWQGWGTALKPAFEPIVVGRKPLAGTVAANVLAHGTGALNIDGCRVGFASESDRDSAQALADLRAKGRRLGVLGEPGQGSSLQAAVSGDTRTGDEKTSTHAAGRWPANVLLDDSQSDALDAMSGTSGGGAARAVKRERNKGWCNSSPGEGVGALDNYGDSSGASRFFPTFKYTAKAPTVERVRLPKDGAGEGRVTGLGGKVRQCNVCGSRAINSGATELTCGHEDHTWVDNPRPENVAHPTVKPLDLMRWLVRLVTPPGGTVLDPFAGSGTTAEACLLEGFRCITIEREADYLPLIVQRIHRRRDPIAAVRAAGEDLGLFGEDTA